MKQLGNLAIVCAKRPEVLMQIYGGDVAVHVGAGPDRENGYFCTQHNSKVRFNEEMLPWGAAGFAHCATKWLENHSK